MVNAAILILTQNTLERKIYLKTTLYFLFKNFNSIYKYPIIILHEKDYDEKSKEEIKNGVRGDYKNLIKFKEIDSSDFEIPTHIDKEKLIKCIECNPVPYWRNIRYRLMCYFWIKNFIKYVENYDYVMRIDDDSIIEEKIKNDLFEIIKSKDHIYMSNLIHVDCGICNYGMKELFETIHPDSNDKLKDMFVSTKLKDSDSTFYKFKKLYEIVENKSFDNNEIDIIMPIMYYNNFFITNVNFWKREDVKEIINKIDNNGNIFYYRYGDAPLHTLIITLLEGDKISRSIFKYSKRLQRECFIDNNNNIHSYMPKDYEHTSCITMKKN
tara:strand:- start:2094 stop:3068 length:975 start_codon:yes stop_codon:yes gene_type:complete